MSDSRVNDFFTQGDKGGNYLFSLHSVRSRRSKKENSLHANTSQIHKICSFGKRNETIVLINLVSF